MTAKLGFQASPEAMGLGWFEDEDGPTAGDLWDLKHRVSEDDVMGWDELKEFVAPTPGTFLSHEL